MCFTITTRLNHCSFNSPSTAGKWVFPPGERETTGEQPQRRSVPVRPISVVISLLPVPLPSKLLVVRCRIINSLLSLLLVLMLTRNKRLDIRIIMLRIICSALLLRLLSIGLGWCTVRLSLTLGLAFAVLPWSRSSNSYFRCGPCWGEISANLVVCHVWVQGRASSIGIPISLTGVESTLGRSHRWSTWTGTTSIRWSSV